MLKLGKLTDYATLVMAELAASPVRLRSASELALRTHVAAPTVAKVLRLLAQAALVEAERGISGGYRLARAAEDITVADIVAAVEGPVALTECAGDHSACAIESHCGVRGNWRSINDAIHRALTSVTLAQMRDEASTTRAVPLQRLSRNANTHEFEVSR